MNGKSKTRRCGEGSKGNTSGKSSSLFVLTQIPHWMRLIECKPNDFDFSIEEAKR